MTARDAAEAFFQGCANQDWNKALLYYPLSSLQANIKAAYGGSRSSPSARRSSQVPTPAGSCRTRSSSSRGRIKKHNLAIRNDNPAKRWLVDGGF